jgi:vancomycin resistance protein VanW
MAPGLANASRFDVALRAAKVDLLRVRRLVDWAARPGRWRRPPLAGAERFAHVVHRAEVPLVRHDAGADPILEAGKRWNLALAAPCFDGLELGPTQPISFWRVLGRPTRARGFRHGMELRAGCVIPTLGGGLCLLANELFRAACVLGWDILERHGHTMQVGPDDDGAAPWGLDATLLWPHVDLRVAPARGAAHLGVRVRDERLIVEIRAEEPRRDEVRLVEVGRSEPEASVRTSRIERIVSRDGRIERRETVAENKKRLVPLVEQRRSCLTCDEVACHARPRDLPDPA